MIATVRGKVLAVKAAVAIIEVGGIGLTIRATAATLAKLREGVEAFLHTTLVVREDSLTLYGFDEAEERDTFEVLQGVSGIGPRTGLAILSVHTPDALRRAVGARDAKALQRVPGIGAKGAQRLLLELDKKLGPARGETAAGSAMDGADVIEALTGLGWPERDAYVAFDAVRQEQAGADTATLLRACLQFLGARK
ncbi:Holliday junction branch migration protein RuvA [Actinobaculum sp. 352]|uniref:Holliday junction branch migration protein RuvA n=1 Tax=Actinobaculum sp. 352 TaxID=2490946 RepID=UPI000F7DE1CD|nr:Holliday junction branch migration protein RuvA [Actinobaculum sp. 352]RTE48701.1 Holliday junction branch migration protein RuvA [Actinobaculum sp. 352]